MQHRFLVSLLLFQLGRNVTTESSVYCESQCHIAENEQNRFLMSSCCAFLQCGFSSFPTTPPPFPAGTISPGRHIDLIHFALNAWDNGCLGS
eukprot:jgi/Botrbrau1/12242/Bobra.0361s0006.1